MKYNTKPFSGNFFLYIYMLFVISDNYAQINYFSPKDDAFDPNIPSPQQFLGYPIGSQHTLHAHVAGYFRTLANISNKVTFQEIGKTYENRPLIILTITSAENHQKIDEIKRKHKALSQPASANKENINEIPIVLYLGYNVHGNEPSSTEAAMLMAYYLTASESKEVNDYLENAVILIDPVLNPDGRDRHSTWVNSHLGSPPVADPLDVEHNEAWPGGRTNHYWFDLNRDWLPVVHPESKARVNFYHQWLPNIVTDFHEMGTNATYFFEPTKPFGSENPVVPRENYDKLNTILANYFTEALDELGSLYFTKEVFDNSYPGYGSTYPDVHGGVGLVFEQASSRGHLQKSNTGELAFSFTIRNHLATSIATVKAGVENKSIFLQFQKEFFKSAIDEAGHDLVKAYIFGDYNDVSRTSYFLNLLQQHQIKCYELGKNENFEGKQFRKGKAYWVPTQQPQYRMVRSMFEKVTTFQDSIFYDASAWAMVLAYGMPHAGVTSGSIAMGEPVPFTNDNIIPPVEVKESKYAYIIDWKDYNAPKALNLIFHHDLVVKAAFKPFSMQVAGGIRKDFGYGSLVIANSLQKESGPALTKILTQIATQANINVIPVNSGRSLQGIDLGSGNFNTIKKPGVLMVVGESISSYEAGEVWHLLDQRLQMPITKIDIYDFNRARLNDYNRLVLVSGGYELLGDKEKENIKAWMTAGGTLIAIRNASTWLINNKLVSEKLKKEKEQVSGKTGDSNKIRLNYGTSGDYYGAAAIGGSIYRADLDITHPLGFGYSNRDIWVYRNSKIFLEPSENKFSTVIKYNSNPLVSGYVSDDNLKIISNSASLLVSKVGAGRAILFADNPNFRGAWYGTNKLFLNALFFGNYIDIP